jgi:hypothetical protein
MQPRIEGTSFGSITIDGQVYKHDVQIGLDGTVRKRVKKLSKALYGTSHVISLEEAEHVYQRDAERLVIGGGLFGCVKLSDEAAEFFQTRGCAVELYPTPRAVERWNDAQGAVIGLFHITC